MRRRRTIGSPPRFFDSLFIVDWLSEGVGEPVWVRKKVSRESRRGGEQFERSEQTDLAKAQLRVIFSLQPYIFPLSCNPKPNEG